MQSETKLITPENIYLRANFIPFVNTLQDIRFLLNHSMIKYINLVANIAGNILLFLPLPFFLIRLFYIHKKINIILYALGISIIVETLQYIFLLGITDIDDVLLNVFGAWLGIVFFNLFYKKEKSFDPS